MIAPHPRRQINVTEQLALAIVATAHAPSPNLVEANESRSPVRDERLFQRPARFATAALRVKVEKVKTSRRGSQAQHYCAATCDIA